jgi:hypothetical protein
MPDISNIFSITSAQCRIYIIYIFFIGGGGTLIISVISVIIPVYF